MRDLNNTALIKKDLFLTIEMIADSADLNKPFLAQYETVRMAVESINDCHTDTPYSNWDNDKLLSNLVSTFKAGNYYFINDNFEEVNYI